MLGKLRIIIAFGGFGVLAVLLLLVSAHLLDAQVLALVGGFLGILIIALACAFLTRLLTRFSRTLNVISTRLTNLENRMAGQDFSALEASLDQIPLQLETIEEKQQNSKEQLVGIRKQLQVLRKRVPAGYMQPVTDKLSNLSAESQSLLRTTFESALILKRNPRSVLSDRQARELFRDYLAKEEFLQLLPLIENFDLLKDQTLSTLRLLYRFFRKTGYWDLASQVINQVQDLTGLESDALASRKLDHEIKVFAEPTSVTVNLPDSACYDPTGPILHMVGRVLPQTQTGYTLRTHYTALAQARKGLPVAVVGQSGITGEYFETIEHYSHKGVDYYLLPGPIRNMVLLDEWLRSNIAELAKLVQTLRPSILHAQSDFFNALIVSAVGKKYGIPTVYESRGFWEYSWLSRTITANRWSDPEVLFTTYGLPTAYESRRDAERLARTLPDHVFTLANVMKDHILESADGQIKSDGVTIVPNAVDANSFPVQERDCSLAEQIGLPTDAVTVGYISSMVEYEGIDTLIEGFKFASEKASKPLSLLLVGDGDYLTTLRDKVDSLGIQNVFFTGRVPHEHILEYYSLIDLFVVPRNKSTVADLVTPLKPFEAFSTGRAVILSDVAALREIAEQSSAAEMFRAGDSTDLAWKILDLVEDHEKRHDLSRRAARWVRNYRSWDNNVNEYYRVYKQLGYKGPKNLLIEAELELVSRGMNPGELVEALSNADLPSLRGWFTIQENKQSASSILEEGWRFAKFEPVKVSDLQDWKRYGLEHRSWGFHLHAWEFMDPLLREYDETGSEVCLESSLRIALNWTRQHCVPGDTSDPMVWYDMSLALRTPRLIALVLRAARISKYYEETVILGAAIVRHLVELGLDRAFNPNNNHGFYTAVSQVHAAKYVPMFSDAPATGVQGKERLEKMAVAQFAEDGTHLEHSPDYHRMLLSSFELAVNDDLIEDEEIKKRVERAAHVLGWMVQPDGALVQFGDSPETKVVRPGATSIDGETQFILSDGMKGDRPSRELAVFSDGGYAFVRSPQPDGVGNLHKSGYLAFSAAFHSRAHKHADDLNVVWYDKGQEILIDGGRFGYGELLPADSPLRRDGFYYAASERQYVEGTMAHNTLMVDGKDQERRTRKPYGSAIGRCIENDGTFDLTGRVQHLDYSHRRRIIYHPGTELLIKDSVFSQSPEKREAILWFNVAGHFEIESQEESVVFISQSHGENTRIRIDGPGVLIKPVRGQKTPLRGWRSRHDRSLEAVWSLGFTFLIETRASVETSLRILE